jgi:sugar phosphate isomerase/epimerase
MNDLCSKLKQAGYDGLELWWPADDKDRNDLYAALEKFNLKVAFLVGSGDPNFQKNLTEFQNSVTDAVKTKPLYINCHAGKDFFSFDQNVQFINMTIALSKETGVPIYHETHRGRILFATTVAKTFLDKVPDLRLTLDISHWCNVHESYLQDQAEVVALALSRTDHIHVRIGHPEGPQVNDPRAPEWENAVKMHFAWWDQVVQRKKSEGARMTFLTEFGPPDYMPTVPYTRQPLGNQWDINAYMMDVLRKRYA